MVYCYYKEFSIHSHQRHAILFDVLNLYTILYILTLYSVSNYNRMSLVRMIVGKTFKKCY